MCAQQPPDSISGWAPCAIDPTSGTTLADIEHRPALCVQLAMQRRVHRVPQLADACAVPLNPDAERQLVNEPATPSERTL
jgi:hypothetical protein